MCHFQLNDAFITKEYECMDENKSYEKEYQEKNYQNYQQSVPIIWFEMLIILMKLSTIESIKYIHQALN